MDDRKRTELILKYNNLFGKHGISFDVGDGWYNILNVLFKRISHHLGSEQFTSNSDDNFQIIQIKEKFGELRVYFINSPPNQCVSELISMAENLSTVTCEDCGKPGEIVNNDGWLRCQCNEHKMAKALDAPTDYLK